MSKKTKRIVFWSISGYITSMFILLGLVFLYMWSPWLKGPTINYYSNNDNYYLAKGSIGNYISKPSLSFEWIEVDGERITNIYKLSPYNGYMMLYSSNINDAWEELKPQEGKIISFTFARGKIDPHLSAPIVQLSYQDVEIISFEDGKNALIESLK